MASVSLHAHRAFWVHRQKGGTGPALLMGGGYIVHRPGLQGWAAPTTSVDTSHDVPTLSCAEQGQLTGPQMPTGYKKTKPPSPLCPCRPVHSHAPEHMGT